jgi:hypothetical protein
LIDGYCFVVIKLCIVSANTYPDIPDIGVGSPEENTPILSAAALELKYEKFFGAFTVSGFRPFNG